MAARISFGGHLTTQIAHGRPPKTSRVEIENVFDRLRAYTDLPPTPVTSTYPLTIAFRRQTTITVRLPD